MRVLVIADLDPMLGVSMREYVETHRIDAVITAGDLRGFHLKGIRDAGVPAAGVYGNHCDRRYLEQLGMQNLHLRRLRIGSVSFTGLEGCVRYKPDPDAALYTQSEYAELVEALPAADVLVTHCPPRGVNDNEDPAHVGIEALVEWVEAARPAVLIHGHTYPERPVKRMGATRVEYVRRARVIEV